MFSPLPHSCYTATRLLVSLIQSPLSLSLLIAEAPLLSPCRSITLFPSTFFFSLHCIALSPDRSKGLLVGLNLGLVWIRDWPKLHRFWGFVWIILLWRNHQLFGSSRFDGIINCLGKNRWVLSLTVWVIGSGFSAPTWLGVFLRGMLFSSSSVIFFIRLKFLHIIIVWN